MLLDDWAQRWCISPDALADLKYYMGICAPLVTTVDVVATGSESRQQSLVRLAAAQNGVWLTRNNVGVLLDANGRPVRFGLANESPAQNKATKSGDLIGIDPVLIGPHHVGKTIGQFVSIEMKYEGWKFNPKDKHEAAQLNWCNFVLAKGGRAMFANGPDIFTNGAWK
jgi:hypothetical protein